MAITAYNRQANFTSFQSSNPTTPLPADDLDAELTAIETTLDSMVADLAKILRSDGELMAASVGYDQLDATLKARFAATPPQADLPVSIVKSAADPYVHVVETADLALSGEYGLFLKYFGAGFAEVKAAAATGPAVLDICATPVDGVGFAAIRHFRGALTSGTRKEQWYRTTATDTHTLVHQLGIGASDVSFLNAAGGLFGLGTSNPETSLDLGSTDAICVPRGTTAQRPSITRAGMVRYNTTLGKLETQPAAGGWLTMGVEAIIDDQASGYWKCNDTGLKFVWTTLSISANPTAVVWPSAFSNAVRGCVAIPLSTAGRAVTTNSITTTGVDLYGWDLATPSAATFTARVLAWGT